MTPLVSIITPVYNAAPWLAQTLDSVRLQSLTDWEHILVDDQSTDGSQIIIERAAQQDARIRFLSTSRNVGPSAARNLALDSARGRFIAFLDADDLWLPEKLARSVEWITRHDYAFIYHDYRKISHSGERVGGLILGPEELNMTTLHTHRGAGCLSVVIDRQHIKDFRFPHACPFLHEDFCAWLSVIQSGHIGHRLPLDLARYRVSDHSRSANKLIAALETWKIYRQASKLPPVLAAWWWLQYAWKGFWMNQYARPRRSVTGQHH
jgi:teichuronic acid biosynthesis glycosyltransferase TuaG